MSEASITEAAIEAARVPLLEREQVAPEAAALYEKLVADRGCVPNMFKALANVPALALGIAALLKPLMGEGALAGWYKELVATRVAALNRCEYCISAHRHLALQRGATAEQVASLGETSEDTFETGPFAGKEKAGFRYAGLLHVSGHAIDDAAFAAARAHFNAEELIELTAVAAAFEFFPRFNSALHIPVTPLPVTPLPEAARQREESRSVRGGIFLWHDVSKVRIIKAWVRYRANWIGLKSEPPAH